MSWQMNISCPREFFKELRKNGDHLADTELKLKKSHVLHGGITPNCVLHPKSLSNSTSNIKRPSEADVKPSILVHSVVLSARSPTMDRLIMDQKRRLTTRHARYIIEVEGTDVDRDVLDDFVDILYFEDVQLTETNVLGLVQCCKQFGVQGELLEKCGDCLIKTLHLYNVVQYLELALTYHLAPLKKECMDIIQCSKTLFQDPFLYKTINIDILNLIMKSDPLPLTEEELIDFVCIWKNFAGALTSISPPKFEQLLELIRFPTCSTKYLTGPLFSSGLLSVEDQHLIMCDAINLKSQESKRSKYSSKPRNATPLVWLESRDGRTFTVEYDENDAIQDLTDKLARVSGLPLLGIDIFASDDATLDKARLDSLTSIKGLRIYRESRVTYRVRTFVNLENEDGTQLSLRVRESDTVHEIKEKLASKINSTQNNDILLSHNQKPLTPSKKLAEEGISMGDTIKFSTVPADVKHRMQSLKMKIAARSLFSSKKDNTKMSKPKLVDNLQWIAETSCKDGEHVEFFLYCGGEPHNFSILTSATGREPDWKCLVHVADFKIRNWKTDQPETRRGWKETAEFTPRDRGPRGKCKWGYTKFMKVTKIKENVDDYVNEHGQLQFEVDFMPERIQSWF